MFHENVGRIYSWNWICNLNIHLGIRFSETFQSKKKNKKKNLNFHDGFIFGISRILWLFTVLILGCGVFYMCYNQWARYKANPTVISLERDYRHWNGTMPAITLCYSVKYNRSKIAEFVQRFEIQRVFVCDHRINVHLLNFNFLSQSGWWNHKKMASECKWWGFWIFFAFRGNNSEFNCGQNLRYLWIRWRWTIAWFKFARACRICS